MAHRCYKTSLLHADSDVTADTSQEDAVGTAGYTTKSFDSPPSNLDSLSTDLVYLQILPGSHIERR